MKVPAALALTLCLAGAASLLAQDQPPSAPARPAEPRGDVAPVPSRTPLRDPTQGARRFGPVRAGGAQQKLPQLALKGRIVRGGEAAALLEVEGRLQLVRVGDELTLAAGPRTQPQPARGASGAPARALPTTRTLRVVAIDGRGVRLTLDGLALALR
ncbi:MAG TPA: hypothetical protein DEA08_20020 [Planctomycetes bacterium]|nr:hypothetical protein [Planctomycetota bacterium]